MSAITDLTLTGIADAIAGKRISSREATEACLARIGAWQPHLNAFIAIEPETALAGADAADAALASGQNFGPLHGVPLAHKDMFYDAGHISTCGSKIRRDFAPDTTSTALARIKTAGTVRLGTLHMVEFAYGPTGHNAHFGDCHNPWNVAHVPGGSSSGSGAAVAARLTFAALGSDTGGSVRMPAHFCGTTGLKTTVGRVSRAGAMPLSHSLDTIGFLTRTAEDAALLLALTAGADDADPTTLGGPVPDYMAATRGTLAGLTIGIPSAFYVEDIDGETAQALDATIATLTRVGAKVITITLPDQMQLSAASQTLLAVEAAAIHLPWLKDRPDDYSSLVRARLENGLAYSGVTYEQALRWRGPALQAHLAAVAGVDAILAPVCPTPAPTLADTDVGGAPDAEAAIQVITRFTRPVNYLGLPSLVVPTGRTASGLPIGMQFIGRPFAEDVLLRIGADFQRNTDFHLAAPELPA
ncbi:amidase [Azorhizobium oxalatiphilum]|uniref:Indoleacetamide hydrolase n=1 Tax=Azorhizobium oxalatiphilum TaxID=980631 RepID=A0A917C8F1_9HYPH|nr:amidase [Azorhizobium oxalatiphilum]GGF73560.1 amidase [Azorhizobium oxalatiphilum]